MIFPANNGYGDKRYLVDDKVFEYLHNDKNTGYITYKEISEHVLFDFITFDKEDAIEVATKFLEEKIKGHRNSIVNVQKDITKLQEKWGTVD